jgi:hypothetical protein
MSGKSNILWWLEQKGHPVREEVVNRIWDTAKKSSRLLTDEELEKLVRSIP